jgi:MinD-like ATPase involved in chromosome partitioning or flagellar assembly
VTTLIAVHSFRGGTGKSNATANLAAVLAAQGRRVAIVDTDIQSPGIHVLFGLDQDTIGHTLNHYLWGQCTMADAAHDVTPETAVGAGGRVWLVPSSLKAHDIARVMREGYDVGLLNEGVRALIADLELDVLLLDTHPGLVEETLLSLAMCNSLVIVLRPDQQDFEGTHVTLTVARRLKVPRIVLLVNKIPAAYDTEAVREKVATTYGCEVAAALPHSEELMELASAGILSVRRPDHPMTDMYQEVAATLMAPAR